MVFICVSIRSKHKVIKPWYARSVAEGQQTLSGIFAEFASGEFDDGDPIDEQFQTSQDLYGKEVVVKEVHVPSKLQRASQRHSMPFSTSSNKANNVKLVVQCEECLKWRVCYAARVLKKQQKQELERHLDTLSYSCGACFQDVDADEESVFTQVYVNDRLTCDSPIEAAYYVTFTDLLCYYCGAEHSLTIKEDHYPLCEGSKETSKLAKRKNTRAFAPR